MNKLSDYIPFIVIAVSLIVSVIGKKKKPGKITEETTLPGKKPGEVIEKKEMSPVLTGSYQKFDNEKSKKPIIQKQEIKQEKEMSSFSSAPVAPESQEDEYSPFSFEEEDVRKAIIYAEIINRKVY